MAEQILWQAAPHRMDKRMSTGNKKIEFNLFIVIWICSTMGRSDSNTKSTDDNDRVYPPFARYLCQEIGSKLIEIKKAKGRRKKKTKRTDGHGSSGDGEGKKGK